MHFWQEYYKNAFISFLSASYQGVNDVNMSYCSWHFYLHYLVKLVSDQFFHCQVITLPFVINTHLGRDTFRLCKFYSSSNFCPVILASISVSCLKQFLWCLSNGDSIIFLFPSMFINWSSLWKTAISFPHLCIYYVCMETILFYGLKSNNNIIGIPWRLSSQESSSNAGDTGHASSIPGSGRSLEEGNSWSSILAWRIP